MQFHHHGYVSTNPRVQVAAGIGLDRPAELPDEMDVLIVGSGPASCPPPSPWSTRRDRGTRRASETGSVRRPGPSPSPSAQPEPGSRGAAHGVRGPHYPGGHD